MLPQQDTLLQRRGMPGETVRSSNLAGVRCVSTRDTLCLRVMSDFGVERALPGAAGSAANLVIQERGCCSLTVFLSGVEECVTLLDGQVGIRQCLLGGSARFCGSVEVLHEGFANGA